MAHVEAFRAFRYDTTRVALAQVATQPYDKISPEMQEHYYAASPYNLVKIILGKRNASDGPTDNPYTRAAAFFENWRRREIFRQDPEPSLYRYTQQFSPPGASPQIERTGFIGLGKLEDYSAGVVHRHEQTLAKPKADRLELLRSTRAHFGQLFMLYSDPAGEIDGLLEASHDPDLETRDEYGASHRVWKIADPGLVDLVRGKMRHKKLVIADGHHRYETALNYRNERQATGETTTGRAGLVPRERASHEGRANGREDEGAGSEPAAAPYEMVMMTLVNMDSPGLVILPTHRVVHELGSFSAAAFREAASAYFSVEEVDASVDAARAAVILREAGRIGTGLLAVAADRVFL